MDETCGGAAYSREGEGSKAARFGFLNEQRSIFSYQIIKSNLKKTFNE